MARVARLTAIFIMAAFVSFVLSGCIGATKIRNFDNRTPLSLSGGSRPIMIKKVISKIPPGQDVGTIQGGLACVARAKVYWNTLGQNQFNDEGLSDILREELTKTGYQVVGDPSSVFEDQQNSKAEFLIAAIIKHIAVNTCYPWMGAGSWASGSGEASVEVEWQVFERQTQSVVFTMTTGGAAARTDTGEIHPGVQAYSDAFAIAARNLLAEPRFTALMSRM